MLLKENKVSPLFNKLRKVLKQEDTTLYIGSGISLWSGLPTWKGLILELADFLQEEGLPSSEVVREKANDDLLLAASLGISGMNNILFKKFLKKACRVGVAKPHNIHKEITSLGPRCFITTNYDQLLEDSLKEFKNGIHFDVVTNRHLPELASLTQSRYSDYVYKIHGDINDIQSVVLSREHYRKLYEENNPSLKTLEILLTTRPVIFIGFGLRDPDFLYIKDRIKNIYKESPSEHYAILPDVNPEEIDYWRENYGIRIISYETNKNEDGNRDHSNLLTLIRLLNDREKDCKENEDMEEDNSINKGFLNDTEAISVIRFIESQRLQLNINENDLLPMRMISKSKKLKPYVKVEELVEIKHNSIIFGDPGSGKTFHLKYNAVKELETLRDLILNDINNINTNRKLTLPIYIDLKGYSGNIIELIESMLPFGLNLDFIKKKFSIIFFLDSFNEMPKNFFEKKLYEKDILNLEKEFSNNIIIISSRTDEGLDKFNYAKYNLEKIDYNFVKSNLQNSQVYSNDVIRLLQKPLYFNLWKKNKIQINTNSTPYTILNSFLNNLNKEYVADFELKVDLANMLSELGYYAINKGQEKIHIDIVKVLIEQEMNNVSFESNQFINWLIEKGLFITTAGSNLSFFHQSITEFFAARKLSKLYKNCPNKIEELLNNTRWDQTLFLTVGFLEEVESNQFINQLFEKDINLSIKAVKYIEYNQSEIIQKILAYILNNNKSINFDYYSKMSFALTNLPVSDEHKPLLEKLFYSGDLLGASAAELLDRLTGYEHKSMFYDALFQYREDFNFGQTLGRLLKDKLSKDEVKKMLSYLTNFEDEEEALGLLQGLIIILRSYKFEDIKNIFGPVEKLSIVQLTTLCEVLREVHSEDSLKVLISLIEEGKIEAIFPIHMLLKYSDIKFNKEIIYRDRFIENIINFVDHEGEEGKWALELIKNLSSFPEIRSYFKQKHIFLSGVKKLAILYSIREEEEDLFWKQYRETIIHKSQTENILSRFTELNWKGKENLLIEFFQVCEIEDIFSILKSFRANLTDNLKEDTPDKFKVSFTTIQLILDKLPSEIIDYYNLLITGNFIIEYTDIEVKEELLGLFNMEDCKYRDFLAKFVISRISSVTTDKLSENAIDFLLTIIKNEKVNNFIDILGNISTEQFVEKKLLPLLETDEEPLNSNLRQILYNAGKNHKKRYIKY
ncbi:SIR2 family protein [Bacillus sp. FJAT-27245]|uniref:SIR2 family protein n=1 Tax=Bacillus sp. FJAT-27245 TaxID=1684144 RepID=UPI0006A7D3AE|nr:SIR2 family protein [Bacillus sp. FJAT-27245]